MHIQPHWRFRRSALLVAFLLLFWIAFFSFPKAVRAHASVIEAIPAIGSIIEQVPTHVTVKTAENLHPDPKLRFLVVYGPDGEMISQGDSQVSLSNPRQMAVSIKPQGEGIYVVRWATVSAEDNEADEGVFVFTVKAQSTLEEPASTPASLPSLPLWLFLAGGGLLAGLTGSWVVGWRMGQRRQIRERSASTPPFREKWEKQPEERT